MNYQKSQIVQSNNYYAFGMQTSDSWTRIDTKPNQYLYNAGSELNNNTNWYETPLRGYDATIGRFNGVDILASSTASLTPYQYANNDPVYWSDPTGAMADDTPWALDRGMRGKYDGYENFADFAFQNWNTHQGGFNTYENFYGSGWNNQMNNGSSFENYGVATGWSDAVANAIIQNVQDAKNVDVQAARNGDAQALQAYGARYGEAFTGHIDFIGPAQYTSMHVLQGSVVGVTTYAQTDNGFILNHYNPNGFIGSQSAQFQTQGSGPETWYYMLKTEGGPHGLVYDATTNTIYDANHPNEGRTNGLISWLTGNAKSMGYKFNMSNPKDVKRFWEFGGGRGELMLAPISIADPAAARAFFESNTGKEWDYNFFTNNCKHYACQGFEAGGANIPTMGPAPQIWVGSLFIGRWNSSMATPYIMNGVK